MSTATIRNIAIILALAAIVAFAPGGGEGADLISQVLSAVFTAVIVLLLGRLYLQFRTEIYGLGDRWRLVLYAAVGAIVVTLAASGRLFDTGPGRWCGSRCSAAPGTRCTSRGGSTAAALRTSYDSGFSLPLVAAAASLGR